jgi:hypothetical protein
MARANPSFIQQVAQTIASRNKEKSRALPDSKGGETPKQLQTYRTDVYTYFTVPSREPFLLYSAENWVKIKLVLETSGAVAVGTAAEISPVLSGHGRLLDTDEEYETSIAKGTRFYIASETVNRVSVTIEPIPWLQQIDEDTVNSELSVRDAVIQMGASIVAAIGGLAGQFTGQSSSGRQAADLPCPPPPRAIAPRFSLAPPRIGSPQIPRPMNGGRRTLLTPGSGPRKSR